MPTSRLGYLFKKYIHNECSLNERYEFLELLREDKNDEELKILINELVANTTPDAMLPGASGDAILQSILSQKFPEEEVLATAPAKVKSLQKRSIVKWTSIAAASVALVISIGYAVRFAGKTDVAAGTIIEASKKIAHTFTGERKIIQLPDGTKIWLSPSSSLEYPPVFSGQKREVRLSGEAFFEVAHNPEQPFIIHSGTLQTKVLGTSFNIQAYDNQENIAVTVVTGKVNVSNDKKVENIELLPNQRAVFYKKTDKLVKESTGAEKAPDILKRKEGTFVYRDEPLQKLAKDIETYFGVSIHVAEAIRQCGVVASFEISDKPEAILELIAISVNGTLHVEKNNFTITGDACPK